MDVSLQHISSRLNRHIDDAPLDVSVIIPFHNESDVLSRCIDSVIAQTLHWFRFEIIFVDDGSDDLSMSIARTKLAEDIHQASYLRVETCLGLANARNIGLKAAKGRYILFVDADDELTRTAVETMLGITEAKSSDLVMGNYDRIDQLGFPISGSSFPQNITADKAKGLVLRRACAYTLITGNLIKRELISNYIFPLGKDHEDLYIAPLVFDDCTHLTLCPSTTYKWHKREGSITSEFSEARIRDRMEAILFTAEEFSRRYGVNVPDDHLEGTRKNLEISIFIVRRAVSRLDRESGYSLFRSYFTKLPDVFIRKALTNKVIACLMENNSFESHFPPRNMNGENPADFAENIIFFCLHDYHLRTANYLCEILEKSGQPACIIDCTSDKGSRKLTASERELLTARIYPKRLLRNLSVELYLQRASLLVYMARPTEKLVNKYSVPTASLCEGVSDFLNLDRKGNYAFRDCDLVLLASEFDRQFFRDKPTFLLGLPGIQEKFETEPTATPLNVSVLINCNFSYGVLTEEGIFYVSSAIEACQELDVKYSISMHPMNDFSIDDPNVISDKSIYEAIEECTVVISRFSTVIIEALALGRPVIYFNPEVEEVIKFDDSLGAYPVCTNKSELRQALENIMSQPRPDPNTIKENASQFLAAHAGVGPGFQNQVLESFRSALSYLETRKGTRSADARMATLLYQHNVSLERRLRNKIDQQKEQPRNSSQSKSLVQKMLFAFILMFTDFKEFRRRLKDRYATLLG